MALAPKNTLGLPAGFKTYQPFPFEGINLQASPLAMKDSEFFYLENFLRLGDGYLRTAWDVGTPLYVAPNGRTIISFFFYNIAAVYYAAVFLSDGSAVQVDTTTGAQTIIGAAGAFYQAATGNIPAAAQWGVQYLLISNNNTPNDFWAWDGSLLYMPGSASPNGVDILASGSNYNTNPTVTPYGGTGSGLVVQPVVQGGSIVQLNIVNPGTGYGVGDVVQLAFSGGGSDTSAILISSLIAQGVGAVNVSAGGSGYTSATVAFSGGGGSGAAASVTIVDGVIVSIQVTSAGSGYTDAPTVSISGVGGQGALAVALLTGTGVAGVYTPSAGSGFTTVPLVTFVGGGGTGATAQVVLTATSIAAFTVTAGGSGYTSAPTLNFVGGGGSGVTWTVLMAGDVVSGVQITGGGSGYTSPISAYFSGGDGTGAGGVVVYAPTSIAGVDMLSTGSDYTSAPAVEISAGANNSAYATVNLMPFGVSGSCMESFNSRLWIANPAETPYSVIPVGGNFQFSEPGNFTDFSTPGGGGLFVNSDRFLQTQYVGIRQSNGYLYFFGDGSVSVVSNVQSSGTPTVTTFTYQNVDPQIGLSWRDSLQDFGRSVIFANQVGIHGLYGGNVTKVSKNLDRLFVNALFPPVAGAITPTSATATLFNVKHYLCLMTIIDPDTGVPRNAMVTWNEKDWVITSQSVNLTCIGTQKISSKLFAWGTDGTSLYPLFAKPSAILTKRLDTKVYGADSPFLIKDLYSLHIVAQDQSANGVGISGGVTFTMSGPAQQALGFPSAMSGVYSDVNVGVLSFEAPMPAWPTWTSGTKGLPFNLLGLRFTSTSPDFALGNLVLGYVPVAFTN